MRFSYPTPSLYFSLQKSVAMSTSGIIGGFFCREKGRKGEDDLVIGFYFTVEGYF